MCSAMRSPMPGISLSFFGRAAQIFDAIAEILNQFGGAFIAAKTADHRAIDFQQLRGLAQDTCDFAIFHSAEDYKSKAAFRRSARTLLLRPAHAVIAQPLRPAILT